MAFFKINSFIGSIPLAANHLLPPNAAQVAENCKLVNGNLGVLRENQSVNTPAKAGTIVSIYKFGAYWLHWISAVDVIKGPIAGDTTSRTFFTEGGEMRVTDATLATGGGTEYPMDWYKVGIPAPTTALTAVLSGSPTDPSDYSNQESRSYVYTFISGWGEEGPTSPASNIVDWNPGQTVDLSGFPAAPSGDYNIIGIRVYRLLSGEYKYLMDVALSAGTTNDAVASTALGEACPSTDWYPPPSGMHSLVNHPGSFVVGATGNEIAPSEAGLPHAFNPLNRQTIPYDVVGLGIVGQGVLILTGAGLWYAAGTTPDALIPEKVELDQSCASKQSIFDINGAVGFASPDGLYVYGIGEAANITQRLFSRDQWQALDPTSMICAYHDGKIFVFYDNGTPGGFIIYPGEQPTKIDLDFHATAVFVDKETDTLYMMVGSNIVSFEGAITYKEATWKGRLERTPKLCPSVARVLASDYPVTFKLYTDGSLKHTEAVADEKPFRLPTGYLAKEFEVECVHSGGEISEVIVAESMTDLKAV